MTYLKCINKYDIKTSVNWCDDESDDNDDDDDDDDDANSECFFLMG